VLVDHIWNTIGGRDPKKGYNHDGKYPIGDGIPRKIMDKLETSEGVVWMRLRNEEKLYEVVEPYDESSMVEG
jgi:hypothetical protein